MEAEVGNDKHHLGTSSARSAVEDQPLTSKSHGARERQKSPRQTAL